MAAGKKTGGRVKGLSVNKKSRLLKEQIDASGLRPLEYMLKVMRDGTVDYARRDEMAKAAAPYMHARLTTTAVEHSGKVTLETLVMEVVAMRTSKTAG